MGNWAATASPASWASTRVSRAIPWLKAARADGLAKNRPSAMLKPMNCITAVGRSVVWACPLTELLSLVGSTVSSST